MTYIVTDRRTEEDGTQRRFGDRCWFILDTEARTTLRQSFATREKAQSEADRLARLAAWAERAGHAR